MKLTKLFISAVMAFTLLLPVASAAAATVDSGTLLCEHYEQPTSYGCDLSIDKQVRVNDGPNKEAPTAAQAVTAKVGDTLTWTITVTDTSDANHFPDGTVTVNDTLPSGANLVSNTPSTGTYSDGSWTFDLGDNLPATLVLVTTATHTGLIENVAALSGYTPPCYFTESCIDPAYNDAVASNNIAQAYVNVPAPVKPVSVTTPVAKAPNTGFGAGLSSPWTGLAFGTAAAGAAWILRTKLRRVLNS